MRENHRSFDFFSVRMQFREGIVSDEADLSFSVIRELSSWIWVGVLFPDLKCLVCKYLIDNVSL